MQVRWQVNAKWSSYTFQHFKHFRSCATLGDLKSHAHTQAFTRILSHNSNKIQNSHTRTHLAVSPFFSSCVARATLWTVAVVVADWDQRHNNRLLLNVPGCRAVTQTHTNDTVAVAVAATRGSTLTILAFGSPTTELFTVLARSIFYPSSNTFRWRWRICCCFSICLNSYVGLCVYVLESCMNIFILYLTVLYMYELYKKYLLYIVFKRINK